MLEGWQEKARAVAPHVLSEETPVARAWESPEGDLVLLVALPERTGALQTGNT